MALLLAGPVPAWPADADAPSTGTEDFTIDAGSVTLAARLHLPAGAGPFPAVVFTHGSGPSGRDNPRYAEEAAFFASAGVASLVYDKRGYGESTGDWKTADFEELAQDAVAAVGALRRRSDIRPGCVGVRGASQSGWILPLAARESSDIDFVILISPPGVTPGEQVLYDVRTDLEDAKFAVEETERALEVTRSALDFARGDVDWAAHRARLDAAAGQPWLEIASGPPDVDDWLWSWIRPVIDFDALPVVEQLQQPVLVLLGEQDRETPSQVAGYRLSRALRANRRSFVRYFPDADHDLRSTATVAPGVRPPLAPGFLTGMQAWIAGLPGCGR
jgi:pimeloyl-ACP methyl ester carboxylesterase